MNTSLSGQIGKIAVWTGLGLAIFMGIGITLFQSDGSSSPTPQPTYVASAIEPSPQPSPAQSAVGPVSNPLDKLSSTDKIRIREIGLQTMQDSTMPTPQVYQEFWSLWGKMDLDQSSYEAVRLATVGISADYQKLFWEDAMTAYKTGRPFKSNEREQLELKLVNLAVLTTFRVKANEDLIESIAVRQSIDTPNGPMLFTEVEITSTLANIENAMKRLDRLFTPPASGG